MKIWSDVKTRVLSIGVLLAITCARGGGAYAQESILQSEPIAPTADELALPSEHIFREPEPIKRPKWTLQEQFKDSPAFFRDMSAKVSLRNFYFARQDAIDDPGNDSEKISWAQGGSALLQSGKVLDVASLKAEMFTSQHLYGPRDKDGALLLQPGQEGYTVLGVANARLDYEGNALTLYRQRHDFPYVNNQDNRMTPNTFESYNYGFLGEGEKPPLQLGFGYLNRMKKRNSPDFIYMSEAAGVQGHERGVPWLGLRVRPTEDIKFVAVDFAGLDFLNIFYSELEYSLKFCDDWALKSSLQFSEQRSIGDDLLTNEDVSVGMWGAQQALSYDQFILRAALTVDDKGSTVRSPFGSYPGYNSSIVEDFNRAGEIAWKLGLSYDFAKLGADGLSAYADYIQGNRAVDDALLSLRDKNETDLNIDYRLKDGWLEGFWLRLRGAFVHEETVGTTRDFRVIVNYDVPLT
jgi:hypothetical protein